MLKRGVGYCNNTDCEDFAKGVFLLNHADNFHCPCCRVQGSVEQERGHYVGIGEIFKEVRVEYNYDPITKTYREIAIIRDEAMGDHYNVYTLHSPLIKTERRALKVAEGLLATLNRYSGPLGEDGVPRTTEIILSFDDSREELARKLNKLAETWASSDQKFAREEKAHEARAQD